MMAAADATTSLRVGALVFDNDYRHPVVLAKEMASIDVLSGGRVELGIGAGWMNTDYEQSGIPHDPASVRIDRMEEAIAILKGLFADGPFDHSGTHYRISGLDGRPKPTQRPHPPLLIGGGGKRVLSIAAREADIVGINPAVRSGAVDAESAADTSPDATDRKYRWLRDAAGDRFDDLEINALQYACVLSDDVRGTAEGLGALFGLSVEQTLENPHVFLGTVDSICESLHARRERWSMSYFVVQGADAMEAAAPIVARLAGT
jgi:probable F420-dependent oxidoreductase